MDRHWQSIGSASVGMWGQPRVRPEPGTAGAKAELLLGPSQDVAKSGVTLAVWPLAA